MTGLIIDNFAGGGGASTGIEAAMGRSVDVAINHDPEAVAMHRINHPGTLHYCQSVWQADPLDVTKGRPVDLAWFSPDCKHFSKAKGGKPVDRNIRDLAWVVITWAQRVRPAVIMLENVEEFQTWGPLDDRGMPCAIRKGETFAKWQSELRACGYELEMRELRACDFGGELLAAAPTIRKRLFIIARCDGQPITWPQRTHGPADHPDVLAGRLKPWRVAADIIDWSLPCPSIFDTSEEIMAKWGVRSQRPLAEATLRRVARGVAKYILEARAPYIVPAHRLAGALVQTGYGERTGQAPRTLRVDAPIGTQVAGAAKHAVVAAFLAQHNTGVVGHAAQEPVSTLTAKPGPQGLVAASMLNLRGSDRRDASCLDPLRTVSAGGNHAAVISAFLAKYYSAGDNAQAADEPVHTVTTKPRHGLVTIEHDGETFAIADIGMRMLTPRERFRAQGFPDTYIIDRGTSEDGQPIKLSLDAQGRMCGNSVCPPLAEALVRANVATSAQAIAA